MSGGLPFPLTPSERARIARAEDERLAEISRRLSEGKHASSPRSLIVSPATESVVAGFDRARQRFNTKAELDAHLKECRGRGVRPPANVFVSGRRYKVNAQHFPRRPETAADAARLQQAALKRRRKAQAQLERSVTIVGEVGEADAAR